MNSQNPPESNEAARAARLRKLIHEVKPGTNNPRSVTNEAAAEAARKEKAQDPDDEGAGSK